MLLLVVLVLSLHCFETRLFAMANPNRQIPSRTPSVPTSGATARNIENLLNINEITSSNYSLNRERLQQRASPRPMYGGIEFNRPLVNVRHTSMSTGSVQPRHPLGGGSGPIRGARSVSASAAPILPGSFGLQSIISTFEPRVIGSSSSPSPRNTASTSPTRPQTRPSLNSARQTSTTQGYPSRTGQPMLPFQTSYSPYGHHIQGSGAPVPMKKPTYLRHSGFHELFRTDGSTSSSRNYTTSSGRTSTPNFSSDEDSESSGSLSRTMIPHGERGRERLRNQIVAGAKSDPILQLPTQWNEHDKHRLLQISEDGRNLHFQGPSSNGEKDAAAARANFPISPLCGIYYYEVTVQDKGVQGHISVGFSSASVKINRLPGWEHNSWGYHGDDGKSFSDGRDGMQFGPTFTTGDTIGCGIDFSNRRAFFTKNGRFLDYVFENIGPTVPDLYPSVGLRTQGEGIRANFGHEPFKYDIDSHVHRSREKVWEKIQGAPVKWLLDESRDIFEFRQDVGADGKSEVKKEQNGDDDFVPIKLPPDYSEPIDKLVLSYLQHHGYEQTANALKAQIDAKEKKSCIEQISRSDVDIKMETDGLDELGGPLSLGQSLGDQESNAMRSRQQVVNAVLSGDIDLVLRLLKNLFPSVLDLDDGFLHLKLKCRKFIELMLHISDLHELVEQQGGSQILEKKEEAKIKGGKSEIVQDGRDMEVDEDTTPWPPTNGFEIGHKSVTSHTEVIPVQSPSMKRSPSQSKPSPATIAYNTALSEALAYGRALHAENPTRPEAQALLRKAFSLISYDNPRKAGGEVQVLISQEARVALAQEVNQAILKSQGRPSRPALERMYRQASAVILQLALMGAGDAAFINVRSELLEA